ncbi:MAG: hypothetical protein JZD41_08740 [Thermoproteus sp.]|nr:hypothetical protein [Thermoproteus sp.]
MKFYCGAPAGSAYDEASGIPYEFDTMLIHSAIRGICGGSAVVRAVLVDINSPFHPSQDG